MNNKLILKAIDLIDEIDKVEKLIDLHKGSDNDDFMVNQYESIKKRHLKELVKILIDQENSPSLNLHIHKLTKKIFPTLKITSDGPIDLLDKRLKALEASL